MANFNFGIDCQSVDDADGLLSYLDSLNLYMDGLDSEDERLSVISSQSLLDELKLYATTNSIKIEVEVWGYDQEYDDAEESGELETHSFP